MVLIESSKLLPAVDQTTGAFSPRGNRNISRGGQFENRTVGFRDTATPLSPTSPRGQAAEPTLKLAALKFDKNSAMPQDGSWRNQNRLHSSPRLHAVSGKASISEGLAALMGKSDADIVQMLLDNHLTTATFIEYLKQHHGSPSHLLSWLQTLAGLASKVGLLLESTRFLTCDLQLARILLHMETTAKALCGAKRAHAVIVRQSSDEILKVGDRGEITPGASESLTLGTSFAAHCARSGKPILVGLPGSPHRAALQFNVDTGTGCRPESSVCVPCLDHLGNVLAVIQVVDRQLGGSFGRDDVVLLQRFAVQCGISLRNAGGVTSVSVSAAPVGEVLSPKLVTNRRPAHQRVASAENQKGALPSRPRPRTSDHATQCDDLLLGVPPLVKLEPRSTEVAADSTVDVADQSSGVAGVIAGAPTPHPTPLRPPKQRSAGASP